MVAIKISAATVMVAMLGASNALVIPSNSLNCPAASTVTQYVTQGAGALQAAASSAAQQFSEFQGMFSNAPIPVSTVPIPP